MTNISRQARRSNRVRKRHVLAELQDGHVVVQPRSLVELRVVDDPPYEDFLGLVSAEEKIKLIWQLYLWDLWGKANIIYLLERSCSPTTATILLTLCVQWAAVMTNLLLRTVPPHR